MIFEWNEKCSKAFYEIKSYLTTLPILILPKDDTPFQIYLSVTNFALGIMLI